MARQQFGEPAFGEPDEERRLPKTPDYRPNPLQRRLMDQMLDEQIAEETGEKPVKAEATGQQKASILPDGKKESAPVHRTGGSAVADGNGFGPLPPPLSRRKRVKGERVPQTEAARRMEMCKQCPELLALDRCRRCGCFMQMKTRIPGAQCPLNKW